MKTVETILSRPIQFSAGSFQVGEADTTPPSDDHVDVEITVISTNVTGNGRQYTLEDLHANAARLNLEGGLIFAMGKHPDNNGEPDAKDNVGLGEAFVRDSKLVSRARIFNTSTIPDMVKRIRQGLVRDVSIEGVAQKFYKTCKGNGCWERAIGLTIHRAVFVSAGADPLAKIERILESIEGEVQKIEATASTMHAAPIIKTAATLEQVLKVCQELEQMIATANTRVVAFQHMPATSGVTESQAPQGNARSNFYEEVRKLVR